jgi:hypothetical protein
VAAPETVNLPSYDTVGSNPTSTTTFNSPRSQSELSRPMAHNGRNLTLIVFGGLPGTGKTTLAPLRQQMAGPGPKD